MRKAQTYLDELIKEGNQFNFDNNKRISGGEYYSEANIDFLAWVSKVEDYIFTNFGENSGPYKMLNSVNKAYFNGHYKSEFESEFNKLTGAIKSCRFLKPNKIPKNNIIVSLLINPAFWTVLVIVIGGAYKFGYDNGIAKFDSEKIEMNTKNSLYKDSLSILKNKLVEIKQVKK